MTFAEYVASNPPRCLKVFAVSSAKAMDEQTVRFGLRSASGEAVGSLLGYDLRDLNPEYDGDPLFVSPLFVEWSGGGGRMLLLDTDIHGHHGEEGSSACIRGAGEPTPFACSSCRQLLFEFEVEFHYWDETVDTWHDEEPGFVAEDHFSLFRLLARCHHCGKAHEASVLDL